jgi:hypothetical protein
MKAPGRAVTGLAIGAAGMLYSRLSGRRPQQDQQPSPQPEPQPERPEVAPDEVERARTELADELARRAGSTFPT